VTVRQSDPVTGLYRTLLAFAAVGVLILIAGLAEFAYFEPINPSGFHVRIVGIYDYDPSSHTTSGPDRQTFGREDNFAAVVDWSGLPASETVQAVWLDSFENVVGGAGPAQSSALQDHTIIPADIETGLKFHLPGQYIFAIERLSGGQPVEVLARRIVEVQRT
jgi:hypothetical protein